MKCIIIRLCLLITLIALTACTSDKEVQQTSLPIENELPNVPNCAADGPGCKQFNPDLKN